MVKSNEGVVSSTLPIGLPVEELGRPKSKCRDKTMKDNGRQGKTTQRKVTQEVTIREMTRQDKTRSRQGKDQARREMS